LSRYTVFSNAQVVRRRRQVRPPKLSPYQRAEALKRRAAGETLASIARSYAVDLSMISRL
jgi:hypothetical protein